MARFEILRSINPCLCFQWAHLDWIGVTNRSDNCLKIKPRLVQLKKLSEGSQVRDPPPWADRCKVLHVFFMSSQSRFVRVSNSMYSNVVLVKGYQRVELQSRIVRYSMLSLKPDFSGRDCLKRVKHAIFFSHYALLKPPNEAVHLQLHIAISICHSNIRWSITKATRSSKVLVNRCVCVM